MHFGHFTKRFIAAGGRHAFGIPGGGPSLELIDELTRHGGEFITTGHEATAALMAAACTRHSGQPALAVSIKGPGFMNLAPALLSNSYEGYACLSVSEAYAAGEHRGRAHKRLDHAGVCGGFVRSVQPFQEAESFFDDCWQRATAEFPGPVHVDLAAGPEVRRAPCVTIKASEFPWREAIRQAQRPVVILGSLALRAGWRRSLAKLACPVFTTVAAKGVVTEESTNAAGIYTGDGKSAAMETQILPAADLVITLGVRSGEVLSPRMPHAKTIVVDSATAELESIFPRNVFGQPIIYLSDAEIAELLDLCAGKSWGQDLIAEGRRKLFEHLQQCGWSPFEAMQAAQRQLPEAAHVVDTGNFAVVAEHALLARSELDFTGTPNGRFMGVGLGYALGACLNPGQRPVILWVGDGGLRSYFSELALAVEQQFRLLVLVMKDGHFGSILGRARSQGWTEAPLILRDRKFRALADVMGLFTAAARSAEELVGAVDQWCKATGPGLIECEFDAETYQLITQQLR